MSRTWATAEVMTLNAYVLVLNVSYEFLDIATLERAVKLIYKGKAGSSKPCPKGSGSSTFRIRCRRSSACCITSCVRSASCR